VGITRLARLLLIPAVATGPAYGQHSNAYVFVAPGGLSCCFQTQATIHAGVGGEEVLGKGIGVGAEIGALAATNNFEGSAIGIASVNGSFHFALAAALVGSGPRSFTTDRDRKFDPFVTGGYSAALRQGHLNMGNFGAGANYWMARRFGLRLEFQGGCACGC